MQAIVQLSLGQASGSQEQLKAAQQFFQVVGSSPSECDTIPGRQAMASCFFLLKQYEDVLVFLNVSVLERCACVGTTFCLVLRLSRTAVNS
jgi:intraflagellar transport protein 56